MKVRSSFSAALIIPVFLLCLFGIESRGTSVSSPGVGKSGVDYMKSGTFGDVVEDQAWLHVLVVKDDVDEEYSLQVDRNELALFLPDEIATELFESGRGLVSDPNKIEWILSLVDPESDPLDRTAAQAVLLQYTGEVSANWGCIKCCYGDDISCCCPPDPEEDPGDKGP